MVREALGSSVARIRSMERLAGGAINENWRLIIEGVSCDVVMRIRDRAVFESRSCAWEYAVQNAAHEAGVRTPKPMLLHEDEGLLGAPLYLMAYVPGAARPSVMRAVEDKDALAAELGRELAKIHRVPIPADMDSESHTVHDAIAGYRAYLDVRDQAHPVLEWGLRWLEVNAPNSDLVLGHGDFRTGNYLVENGRLVAVLDWEFSGPADPHADIGWFCAKCWRGRAYDHEAGGLASREALYGAYEDTGGRRVDRRLVAYWEVMAHVRWAIIALQQADRFMNGAARSLEHALLGRRLAELEHEILSMTAVRRA